MANRTYTQFQYTHEKYKVHLEVVFDGNTTSNPLLKAWNPATASYATAGTGGYRGVKSVERTAQGTFKLHLQDRFHRLLGMDFTAYAIDESTAPLISDVYIKAQAVNDASDPSITIVMFGYGANTAIDPAANDRFYINLYFSNSATL